MSWSSRPKNIVDDCSARIPNNPLVPVGGSLRVHPWSPPSAKKTALRVQPPPDLPNPFF